MFDVKLLDLGCCDESEFTRVVCVCKYKGKYVFSYNKKRNGWEIPGGHIEENETWEEAAKREMYEETGATKVKLTPICVYKISTYALLCYCEILEMSKLPEEFEMSEILLSNTLPDNLSFPDSHKLLFDKAIEYEKNIIRGNKMAFTINIYYKGQSGKAREFANEMISSGIVDEIRNKKGNLRYEYFLPIDDEDTVLLIDSWENQEALDNHHKSDTMSKIMKLRDKYDLHMKVERYILEENSENDQKYIKN